jgi:hypothetical protein
MGRSLALIGLLLLTGCPSAVLDEGVAPPYWPARAAADQTSYEVNFQTLAGPDKIRTLTCRLDDLAALSVTTLWLMPIFPIGQVKSVGLLTASGTTFR